MAVSTIEEERVHYEPRYLQDRPDKEWPEVVLFLRRFAIRVTPKGHRILRGTREVHFFDGKTLEDAEEKMVSFIEEQGATELPADPENLRWVPEDMAERAERVEHRHAG